MQRDASIITHLFFVDDSIIFTCASVNEATIVTNILCRRDVLSGQKVNVEKCEICLSNKLEPHLQYLIKNDQGFREVIMHGKYLGLLLFLTNQKISLLRLQEYYNALSFGCVGVGNCCGSAAQGNPSSNVVKVNVDGAFLGWGGRKVLVLLIRQHGEICHGEIEVNLDSLACRRG